MSDRDGTIGSGASFSTSTLSVGTHVVTATATDGQGLTGTDTVTIAVTDGGVQQITAQVAVSDDDAEESGAGNISLGSSDLELVETGGAAQVVGIRFPGLDIPAGAEIVSATLQFTVDETSNAATSLLVQAEATVDAAPFQRVEFDISGRTRTATSVAWQVPIWPTVGDAGPDQQTPDLAAVLQEVVDQPGWASGNAVVFIVTGSGTRTAESFDGAPAGAPVLDVEYTVEPNDPPLVTITTPFDGSSQPEDQPLNLSGTATDTEDGDLSTNIVWASDHDGTLGIGASLAVQLSPGIHAITATVVDSGGRTGSSSVTTTMTFADPVIIGAGDIAKCPDLVAEQTAQILDRYPGATIFTTGDNAYFDGSPTEFAQCYDPTWGRHKANTRPSTGNHDYRTADAAGYFGYFGAAAGSPDEGFYDYEVGTWLVLALNSNCDFVGGCEPGSPQYQWLESVLAANAGRMCTAAYWHHPRFSSGPHGGSTSIAPLWDLLYAYGTDVVIAGHLHAYERLVPVDQLGVADPAHGINQFIVGTGGTSLTTFIDPPAATTATRQDTEHGVLMLRLRDGEFAWEFLPVVGGTFTDSGTSSCISAANAAPAVTITSPGPTTTVQAGTVVSFAATAADPEDGDVTASIMWTSDLDGQIGSGPSMATSSLSVGIHIVTATARDGAGLAGSNAVTVEVLPTPGNSPPTVDAGPDQTVAIADGAVVTATTGDDGVPDPPGAVSVTWSQTGGVGAATFADPTAATTAVTFSQVGVYELTATASDGEWWATDALEVTVTSGGAPATIEVRINAAFDDVEEDFDGSVTASSSDLELVEDPNAQVVGLRFTPVEIPAGATVTNAYIQFTVDEETMTPTNLEVRAELSADAAPFTTADFDVTSRPVTSATALWSPDAWSVRGESGPAQQTTDLTAVLQQVVDLAGWKSGNALVFVISGSGKRVAEAFDGDAPAAALLHVEFTSSAPSSNSLGGPR